MKFGRKKNEDRLVIPSVDDILKSWKDAADKKAQQPAPVSGPTVAEQVSAIVKYLNELSDVTGYKLRPTIVNQSLSGAQINTSIATVEHKVIDGVDVQYTVQAPTILVERGGVRLRARGPGSTMTGPYMTTNVETKKSRLLRRDKIVVTSQLVDGPARTNLGPLMTVEEALAAVTPPEWKEAAAKKNAAPRKLPSHSRI